MASSAQHRRMQKVGPRNVEETIRNSVDHDLYGVGSSLIQGLPSKVINHLTGAICSSVIPEGKSRRMLLDCFKLLNVGFSVWIT